MAQQKRDEAVKMANWAHAEIVRLTAKILNQASDHAAAATWPDVGSLHHIAERLAELVGEQE